MTTPAYEQKRLLFLSSLGGALEFYDFIIYIFLSPIIEKVFFASSSASIATLKTLAIFSVGYLIRPLGGVLFSHFGDRYGRKVTFLLTIVGMAAPSLAIGLLPTTAQIGEAAPLLLLLFRMMQGLALGGELPAAITFIAEHAPSNQRAFSLATLFFGVNFGLMLGSLVSSALSTLLSQTEILAFGWRIPFLFGGVVGTIAVYLRRHLRETAAFNAMIPSDRQKVPLITLLKTCSREVALGFSLVSIGSVTVFLYLYWPQYLFKYMHYNYADLMQINTFGTLVLSVTILLGGWIADRIGYKQTYLLSAISLIALTYPLFYVFHLHNINWVMFSYMIFSIFFGLIPSAYASMISQLFPTSIRYSGVALSYNLAYAIIGGLSPIICTLAIEYLKDPFAPAYYVMIIATFAAITCWRTAPAPPNTSKTDHITQFQLSH